ncbi:MAG TPA: thermostable hemolysin [Burkholderiales bacterium]|nr:thermostable hemolysin [Burkholderiales bacterium]
MRAAARPGAALHSRALRQRLRCAYRDFLAEPCCSLGRTRPNRSGCGVRESDETTAVHGALSRRLRGVGAVRKAGRPVFRESIAEVGNLAALRPGGTRVAIVAVLQLLAELKFDWVVCTATRNVRNALARCGLPPWSLARASREAMGAAADSWGTSLLSKTG